MTVLEQAEAIRADMNKAGSMFSDEQAVTVKHIYEQWEKLIGTEASPGLRFLYGEDLYKVGETKHTFSREWAPGIDTAALYTRIDETHAGTVDDPIPYAGNMELEEGKYYSQDDVIYHCFRDTGIAVYADLKDLVDLYVEVAV